MAFSLLYHSYEGHVYDPKALGVAFSYTILLSKHLLDSICSTISLESELISLQRLTFLEKESMKPLEYNEIPLKNHEKEDNSNSPLIEFKDISLYYDKTLALDSISFQVYKGEKVAFCGRTGSGKTSLFSLLYKLYPYQSGTISFDSKPLPKWPTKELRSLLAMIPQNGFLFKGTLKENLDPGNRFTEGFIKSKIEEYGLEEALERKSLGFIVEKEGGNLSNGEKQVVNFLQNILCEKEVVILDEATSNLDGKLDKKIMSLVESLCKKKTLLLISHRLENLDFFDKIYVLSNGKIVESGSFKSLTNNPLSLFNSLKASI